MIFLSKGKLKADGQMLLLAPAEAVVPQTFRHVRYDADTHRELLTETQKMRGAVYVADRAIEPESLLPDGRHYTPGDHKSWHVVSLDRDGRPAGCARYLPYTDQGDFVFSRLSAGRSALAKSPRWSSHLTKAVQQEVHLAKQTGASFVEVGGWALREEFRCSTDGLRIALATYALGRRLGGCIGLTTATVRHNSASMLRKLGGASLEAGGLEIPKYYDPQYRCDMEILRFDSSKPNPRYESWIDRIEAQLASIPVVTAAQAPWVTEMERMPVFAGAQPGQIELAPQFS